MAFPFQLIPFVVDYAPTGSREICNPPPMDTDEDWIVLVRDRNQMKELEDVLKLDEWQLCGKDYKQPDITFKAYRKGELNLIFTQNITIYERYKLATRVCKFLNILDKKQRCAVFGMLGTNDLGKRFW